MEALATKRKAEYNAAADGLFCLAVGLAIRFATFGDPNIYIDEAFYFYVGQEMHLGSVPYVDIWDRKPPGIFILFWMFAGISKSVLAYQIPAWLFVSYTAFIISRIVLFFSTRSAALVAATSYLSLLLPLHGQGGQTPIFYNAFVATAVWLVLNSSDDLGRKFVPKKAWFAVLLCGLAITVKQTAAFEGIFLGLYIAWRLWSSGLRGTKFWVTVAALATLGALPFAACSAWFFIHGYWERYWFAMITSNLARPAVETAPFHNIPILLHALGLLLLSTFGALLFQQKTIAFAPYRPFMLGWLASALLGFLAVPLFVDHYALPLLVPMCVISAANFGNSSPGTLINLTIPVAAISLSNPFDLETHQKSRKMFNDFSEVVEANPSQSTMLIYDGPLLLYTLPKVSPATEMVFPWHLVSISEKGATFADQERELAKVLNDRPDWVIVSDEWKREAYPGMIHRIEQYIHANCKLLKTDYIYQKRDRTRPVFLYGKCNDL